MTTDSSEARGTSSMSSRNDLNIDQHRILKNITITHCVDMLHVFAYRCPIGSLFSHGIECDRAAVSALFTDQLNSLTHAN